MSLINNEQTGTLITSFQGQHVSANWGRCAFAYSVVHYSFLLKVNWLCKEISWTQLNI